MNYPIKLTNKLGHIAALNGFGDFRPTEQEELLKAALFKKIDSETEAFDQIISDDLQVLNEQILKSKIPFIKVSEED